MKHRIGILDLSPAGIVGLSLLLTIGSYVLLTGFDGPNRGYVWGGILLLVATGAGVYVVFRGRADQT